MLNFHKRLQRQCWAKQRLLYVPFPLHSQQLESTDTSEKLAHFCGITGISQPFPINNKREEEEIKYGCKTTEENKS